MQLIFSIPASWPTTGFYAEADSSGLLCSPRSRLVRII
jgi:hypothetical protein